MRQSEIRTSASISGPEEAVEAQLAYQSSQKPTHAKHTLAAHNSNSRPSNANSQGVTCGYKLFRNDYGKRLDGFRMQPVLATDAEKVFGERLHLHSGAIICVIAREGYDAVEFRFPDDKLPPADCDATDLADWTTVAARLGEPVRRSYKVGDVIGLHPDEVHAITAREAGRLGTQSIVLELPTARDVSVVFDYKARLLGSLVGRAPRLVASDIYPTRHEQQVYGYYHSECSPEENIRHVVERLGG